jgi:hypothetical protein
MRRPPFTRSKIPGTHSCYRLSRTQGHIAAARIWSIEKSKDFIGNRTRDLPACSTALILYHLHILFLSFFLPSFPLRISSFASSFSTSLLVSRYTSRLDTTKAARPEHALSSLYCTAESTDLSTSHSKEKYISSNSIYQERRATEMSET